ncbi:NAD-dependent epimerase/dehydratase family protein [Paenibacillus urinalis]|uniref:NAD-dependent epimerase/dehydratase family protein n=1 Tax=Paenibacillus urinalis TaxID=521520 RepID=A0AAX3MWB3_9BACL|nr:NAD-dependent epimerase/dehydratase family protein [Paenibacillus urinalis]WDH80707.1 NAD-dependent epimerase/dehydratase family protein [Paenibacillus urinalis]WDH96760.1 NAD-dependent epimerase/dehydratase family protein [Paenibacillus urinalis]WDI00404.1 NAD-dependent epimerase/dehydratase family protein [Paenibacillus urinalis]
MTNMDVHKKIIVFGGDGFCGWPTSLHLSSLGHEVIIIDNLSRRRIDEECQTNSLTPIQSMEDRLKAWKEVSGKRIQHYLLNVAEDYDDLLNVIMEEKPDVMIHFAEQRSAPYSMKSSRLKRYTVNNNINATHNILSAIVESGLDIHLIHLGTMGVYGYGTAGIAIPEGYLDIEVVTEAGDRVQQQILYPTNPGSIYHMTKSQDQLLFAFYSKNDRLRITDLHQGIVWGTHTQETQLDERLINRFDYDGDYGTVLNRFLMQAAIGHPITVHGTGGQTRAFIHIQDTVRCIQLAVEHPPATGDRVLIMNQMTETHRVIDLAQMVSRLTGSRIAYVPNPRQEAAENDLHVENALFLSKGLVPITLNEGLLSEITEIARKYGKRADHSKIPAMSTWTKQQQPGIL